MCQRRHNKKMTASYAQSIGKLRMAKAKKPFSCEAVPNIRPEGWAIEFNASAMRVQKADCHEKAFSERLPGTTILLN